MLVTSSGSQLRIVGQSIGHLGRFVDNFQRQTNSQHAPLGMGWQDLGELFPASYDIARIYNGSVVSGDPYWRGKNGETMAPDDDWANYGNYPGQAIGGIGGAIRNVGDGIYNYDVTCRIGGVIHGIGGSGPEAEGTPIVGVNTSSAKLGYGAWLVNLGDTITPFFVMLIGYVANPPEDFTVTHTAPVVHTQGQEHDITLKYRETGFTVWMDGSQLSLTVFQGASIGFSPATVAAEHQNSSWAGFEYDSHITEPSLIPTTPCVLSYEHQVIA